MGRLHAARSGQHAGSGQDPRGVVRGPVHPPVRGSCTTQSPFLAGLMGRGGFRRERVVQRRRSHSLPAHS